MVRRKSQRKFLPGSQLTPRHSPHRRPLRITRKSVRPRRRCRRESQIEPWLTPSSVIDNSLCIRLHRTSQRTPIMSLRRTTGPSTRKHHESSASGRSELTARGKTKKQSAKKKTALDSRFHRTLRRCEAEREACGKLD